MVTITNNPVPKFLPKFSVGDRVVSVKDNYVSKGMYGTIKKITADGFSVGVKWDGFSKGHDLDGLLTGKDSVMGYYVSPQDILPTKRRFLTTLSLYNFLKKNLIQGNSYG